MLLGYRHPEVEEAIRAQLEAGPMLSLAHPVEVEVAEMLMEMVPCAEMVAFGKNGSDVTTAAVRVARAATGRDLVLQCGFHGFHDWYTCQYRTKNVHGIPKALRAFVHEFPYNDLDALEWLFMRYPDEVAAVVMEPVNIVLPEPGYLEGVRELDAPARRAAGVRRDGDGVPARQRRRAGALRRHARPRLPRQGDGERHAAVGDRGKARVHAACCRTSPRA